MATSNGNTLQAQESSLNQQWMNLQETELSDLHQALELRSEGKCTEAELILLIERTTRNFEVYMDDRINIARQDPSAFFAPPWCTTLESSGLWLGGCRPSSFSRLIHALCGSEIETQLTEHFQGVGRDDNLGDLSHTQLCQVDKIQMKTVREETKLSSKLASLQEDMADQPMAEVVKKEEKGCEPDGDVHAALDENGDAMEKLMEEAYKLRLETYKELMGVLTPLQGVHFLAASKKLRICTKAWGEKRDQDRGRCDH